MRFHLSARVALACLLGTACLGISAARAAEGDAALPAGHFKIEARKGVAIAGIQKRGDTAIGECFEMRRGSQFVGYAQVAAMDGPWPQLAYLFGRGRVGDLLVPVPLPVPYTQLLVDDLEAPVTKELQALLGDRLKVEELGDRMTIHGQCTARIVIIHGGVFFMMGDTIAQPFAQQGGTLIIDTLAYSHLRGNVADETRFDEPPTLRVVGEGPLTAGIAPETRIPWYGTRKAKKGKYVARYFAGLPQKENEKIVATDGSAENSGVLDVDLGGRMLVLDLITPTGRAGRDPGAKNKLLFVSRVLGTGPRYARYIGGKPHYDDLLEWFTELAKDNADRMTRAFEGGRDKKEDYIYSFTLGAEGKPLAVLAGGLEGTDWLSGAALLRLAEVLLDNPGRDPKIEWLLERLRIKIIPALNVPGYRNDTAANENGVLLNRNFPYHWDAFADKKARGREPFSEPGTAILQRAIETDKAAAFLEVAVDDYDAGYRIVRGRDASEAQQRTLRTLLTILNARLLRRFVVGDKPLTLRVTRDKERPSAINWAASKGALAASLKICGDGEDSLTSNDVAIEGCLHFLVATALSLEKPEPPPPPPPPKKKPADPPAKRTRTRRPRPSAD